jgi:hypothetical protein
MKRRSKQYPEVFYEQWKTPISENKNIVLERTLQTITQIHFFFCTEGEENKKVHVMTVRKSSPLRVMEQKLAKTCIGKYFGTSPRHLTWKLWETRFIRELDEGSHALSRYRQERDKTIFEHLVMAKNKWIQVVDDEPEWKVYRGIHVDNLVEQYARKRYYE